MTEASTTVLASAELHNTALRLRQARDAIKEWRKVESETRDALLGAIGAADAAVTSDGETVASLRRSERGRVNSKRLQALYPDVYDDVLEPVEVVTVDVP